MREDMFKVIVERPRHRWKSDDATARRLRNDIDGPNWLRTRAGYGPRALNENLAPLRRYLHSQVGRPWNRVFSEISANIDRRNTVQQHIYQHIDGVGVEALTAEPRHDVILHRDVSITRQDDRQHCEHLYGSPARYAVSKKQLSSRELDAHGLKPPR